MGHRWRVTSEALSLFLLWTGATWFFEGRIETLLRPEAIADRWVYALLVNMLVGTAGGWLLLLRWRARKQADRFGFVSGSRMLAGIAIASAVGIGFLLLQSAASSKPVAVLNAFCQVLVVSIAEIVVCWCAVGIAVRSALANRGAAFASVAAAFVSSLAFALYHFAHSAPFNTLPMVALLFAVGLATSVFFFLGRDAAATVVFHNFLATFGVLRALADANALASFETLQPALLAMAMLGAAVFAGGYARLRATGGSSGSG
jgi:hypothetical protein